MCDGGEYSNSAGIARLPVWGKRLTSTAENREDVEEQRRCAEKKEGKGCERGRK